MSFVYIKVLFKLSVAGFPRLGKRFKGEGRIKFGSGVFIRFGFTADSVHLHDLVAFLGIICVVGNKSRAQTFKILARDLGR